MNTFGTKFRLSIFGESHGAQVGVVLDGVPAGLMLCENDFEADLSRRRAGERGTTQRKESDKPKIVSGLHEGHTTGAPLTILFENEDTRSGDYANLVEHPRPSHADFVAAQKWHGMNDPRGGGHFSGRLTVALVAAGVVAKKVLSEVAIKAFPVEIGGQDDSHASQIIEQAMRDGDSVGGVIECRATGVPVGLGDPFFDSVESVMAHILFAIPAVKGVEFGSGFAAAAMRGSQHNDPIISPQGHTLTNNAGGIVGGITNGNEIVVRVAIKPTASISCPQQTYNFETQAVDELKIKGRHDACIALRAPVVVEAAVAIALANFK